MAPMAFWHELVLLILESLLSCILGCERLPPCALPPLLVMVPSWLLLCAITAAGWSLEAEQEYVDLGMT